MAEELLSRKDVKKELTWDLTLIYKDEAALMADADRLEKLTGEIESLYKGKLGSAETVNKCLDEYREAVGIIRLLATTVSLQHPLTITIHIIWSLRER